MNAKKILIVDFDKDHINSLENLLRPKGFQIFTAMDGLSGLEKFKAEKPDLVILESLLPKLNAFELCNKMFKEHKRKIPVIMLTGAYDRAKDKKENNNLYGVIPHNLKPYKQEELLKIISDLLEQKIKTKSKGGTSKSASLFRILLKGTPVLKDKKPPLDGSQIELDKDNLHLEPSKLKDQKKEQKIKKEDIDAEKKSEKSEDEIDTKLEEILAEFGLNLNEESASKKTDKKAEKEESLSRLGEYILLEKIGSGGMGEVFKVKRKGVEGFEKTMVIKRIHSHLVEENEKAVTMFIDEAKLASQLSHPNIVHIYELGKVDPYYFIAMEYVPGKDLGALLKKLEQQNRIMPYEYSAYVGIKIGKALDYSHQKYEASGKSLEIIHRDVSPRNILISFEGEVKLTDFGVAKASAKIHQTIPGSIKGKIPYMSPQQARGEEIDHRSDIFSLGSVLFEMATGERAFSGENEMAILNKVQKGETIAPSQINPETPKELENIILKSLQYKPEKRYQDAVELQEDLDKFLKNYNKKPAQKNIARLMIELFSDKIEKKKVRGPHKLILADDSPVIQKVVNLAFSKEDFEIHALSNGKEVVESIEQINPDIILLDVNLPKRNGYEICKFIKDNDKLNPTPVIFLKEAFEKIDREVIKKLDYDDIIQKPFDSRKLVIKVKEILDENTSP